jgi:hypothetical protein
MSKFISTKNKKNRKGGTCFDNLKKKSSMIHEQFLTHILCFSKIGILIKNFFLGEMNSFMVLERFKNQNTMYIF